MKEQTATALTVLDRGRNIDATVTGQGSVTVVLLTGLGAPAQWWYDLAEDAENLAGLLRSGVWTARPFLAPSLGAFARVVSYDRAGIGDSLPPGSIRTLEDFVTELKAVLDATCPSRPAVLVGHSIGGVIAFELARRSRERVAALVLLDSSHPDQLAHFAACASASQLAAEAEERREMAELHPERPDLVGLLAQGPLLPDVLNDLPVLVISRSRTPWDEARAADFTRAQWEGREDVWQQLQAQWAAVSSRAEHVLAENSGHYVQFDEPELVIRSIQALLSRLDERGSHHNPAP